MTRPPAIHYLRANKGERSPHRLLIADTEARTEPGETRELQILRLWAARLVNRHGREGREGRTVDYSGDGAAGLVDTIEAAARTTETLWVFTHNLSYDLVLTRLPLLMLGRGWELGRHNLASEAPWALLKRGSKSVRLADSWSWLPVAVKSLGLALGRAKPELPHEDETEAVWLARCQADLAITAEAVERLMDEWDTRRLGWWSITGPATGWNSMLHMGPEPTRRNHDGPLEQGPEGPEGKRHKSPVINPDAEARAFERQALYSGRRDLWRRGKVPGGPFVDLDFRSAHLAACASYLLPAKRAVRFEGLALEDWHLHAAETSVIAECVVATETPRYPLRWRNAVLHPVGTFSTVLAGPELAEAASRGELVSVGAGYSYRLSAHMQTWAHWALGILAATPPAVEPMLQVAVKGWSRTVPGRWAMVTSRDIRKGRNPLGGWSMEPLMVGSPPRPGSIVRIGDEWTESVKDQEADDSFPAVLAFIQSWVRVLLNRAIDRMGPGAVLQCNTDSLLVYAERLLELGAERAERERDVPSWSYRLDLGAGELSAAVAPLVARIKTVAERVEIGSPQHLRLDDTRRYAGVPGSAVETSPETFTFWTWPKMAGQMERGDPRGYIREVRTVRLGGLTVNRWAYLDGCCEPVRAGLDAAGGVRLCLPPPGGCSLHLAPLSPLQHPTLRPLLQK